ncbi:hypothetical protein Q0Z83_090260 [Actinoplanes sichuanensis]|nr:hypothetical protein Q0Z83_090260 [Actinoplanes sichuanensis]
MPGRRPGDRPDLAAHHLEGDDRGAGHRVLGWYWTSDRSDPEPDRRWALNYDDGYTNYREIDTGYAHCVR